MKQTVAADLNQTTLAAAVAAEAGVSGAVAERVVAATLDVITRTVTAGHRVSITNFGAWQPAHRAERPARNPRTGAPMTLPERWGARFRFSPRFLAIVASQDPTASRRKHPSRNAT